eukprot:5217732-Pyramimonas_sp.AAC.1
MSPGSDKGPQILKVAKMFYYVFLSGPEGVWAQERRTDVNVQESTLVSNVRLARPCVTRGRSRGLGGR